MYQCTSPLEIDLSFDHSILSIVVGAASSEPFFVSTLLVALVPTFVVIKKKKNHSPFVTSPPYPSIAPVRLGQHVLEHWMDPLLQHRERLLGQRLLVHARVLGVELPEMDSDLVESRPEDEASVNKTDNSHKENCERRRVRKQSTCGRIV